MRSKYVRNKFCSTLNVKTPKNNELTNKINLET